ncbi:MAG: bacteriohopanetetrol glucosamine biosynthesis glycosyltransferase HpnI [Syntrophales bacterium]
MFHESLRVLLLLLIAAGGAYAVFSLFCVQRFFASQRPSSWEAGYPPVSILKPVKGADHQSGQNLASFIVQDYPEYEVLLGFADENDEGLPAARQVESESPRVKVVINRKCLGVNPKVSNLYALLEMARYPLLLISDSDIRVTPGYLREIVADYLSGENVGVVTSLKRITSAQSLGALLESLTIAADLVSSVLVARRLEGITFGFGSSLLLSRQALEEIGGFSAVADYLAEDYQIGNRLWKKGYRNILSSYVIENVIGKMSISDYVLHQLRWARTYRACRPKGFLGYGITHILPFSLLLLLLQGTGEISLSLLAASLALRWSLLLSLYKNGMCPRGWLRSTLLLPIKDLFSFGIWIWSFFGSTVLWRGTYYSIIRGGLLKKVGE